MRNLAVARYAVSRPSVSLRLAAAMGVSESSAENTLNTALQRVACAYHALTIAGKLEERDRRFASLYDLLSDAPPVRSVRQALAEEVDPDADQDKARAAYLLDPTPQTRDAFLRVSEKALVAVGETVRALRADKEMSK